MPPLFKGGATARSGGDAVDVAFDVAFDLDLDLAFDLDFAIDVAFDLAITINSQKNYTQALKHNRLMV